MAATQAHLNSGPMDDQYVVVEAPILRVAKTPAVGTNAEPKFVPFQTGEYWQRTDGNGDPVPHDLAGTVEFDWKGWNA